MSRISSAPAPTSSSSGRDAVAGRRGSDEPTVVGRRVLGQRRVEPAGREQAGRRAPVAPGDVFRSNRTIDSIGQAEAGRDLLVGRLPAVRRRLRRQVGRDGRRAHPSGILELEATGDGVAMGGQALDLGQGRDGRREAGQALPGDALDLGPLAVRLDAQAAGRASQTAGRQDVVGARSRSRRRTPAPTARRTASRRCRCRSTVGSSGSTSTEQCSGP